MDGCDPMTMEDVDYNAALIREGISRSWRTSLAMKIAGVGTLIYAIFSFFVCHYITGNEEMSGLLYSEMHNSAYSWPMLGFFVTFSLNLVTLLFERESSKMEFAFLTCYLNLLAAHSDYVAWRGYGPILLNAWDRPFMLHRQMMWLFDTPVMMYLLCRVSDLDDREAVYGVVEDLLMIVFGIVMHMVSNIHLANLLCLASWITFMGVIRTIWKTLQSAIEVSITAHDVLSLQVFRFATIVLWFGFAIIQMLANFKLVTVKTEEHLMISFNFFAKILLSSTLMYSNLVSMEQRKLHAMQSLLQSSRSLITEGLRSLESQKEHFIACMSHELRTPLNGIIGLSDALLEGACGDLSTPVLRIITTIKTSGTRLMNLVNDILDAASMKKGGLIIHPSSVDLKRLSDGVLEICKPLAAKGVVIINGIRSDCPNVCGDYERIIQILFNLVGNSCKFTHQGRITINAIVKIDMVEVSISDTGIGIPADKLDQIFEEFKQVDMSSTRKYGGMGLGLSLVKQLVEAHGGAVSVSSVERVGTTMSFTLKIYDQKAADSIATHSESESDDTKIRPPSARAKRTHTRSSLVIRPEVAAHMMPKPGSPQEDGESELGDGSSSRLKEHVSRMLREKSALECQLSEVTKETERLQELVEKMEARGVQ